MRIPPGAGPAVGPAARPAAGLLPSARVLVATRVLVVAGVLLTAGACGRADLHRPPLERRVAACVSPSAAPASGRVTVEFRRGDQVLASGSIPAGGVFAAPVPTGADIDVYADGKLLGNSDGGDAYLHGAGCPDTPTG